MKKTNQQDKRKSRASNESKNSLEGVLWSSVELLTESAYQMALRLGFQESFVHFIEELHETMESVVQRRQTHVRRTKASHLKTVPAKQTSRTRKNTPAVRAPNL